MKIERFEDVQGWQAGRVLARMVYEVTNKGDVETKRLVGGFIRYLNKSKSLQS